ncbi:hypothetical protein Poly51_41780 [Rubripirellula tenax]|uniref:IgA FC receptor n=1 Tax=Rubripirellula tenax TaxID=2528015 RepID=A0A5C6EQG8_9BACT|nr:hypothetical protein [Rubripirellula tenax]TWU50885.1 hypothetical protein Poly51_41780 [Rubripirellula tenax]
MNQTRNRSATFSLACFASLAAMGSACSQSFDTAQTRLRPIGAPSAVDQYRSDVRSGSPASGFQETAYTPTVRQVAMQFQMPPGGSTNASPPTAFPSPTPPPQSFSPAPIPSSLPPSTIAPPSTLSQNPTAIPRSLPTMPPPSTSISSSPISPTPARIPSSSDYMPIAPPQLNSGGFATAYNCPNVTGPSAYSAASGIGCGQVGYQAPASYAPNPSNLVPLNTAPGTMPPPGVVAPPISIPTASAAPVGPLISFGQSANPVQVGAGLFGQPKAYVPGQGVRNWLRYLTP